MKVLFVSDYKHIVKDGLYQAIEILKFDKYNIGDDIPDFNKYDFILGHGAFKSRVDDLLRTLPNKKGLCIAGNVHKQDTNYDVLFYETEWVRNFLELKGNLVHAFGVNTGYDFCYRKYTEFVFDYLSVGAFAKWKRHDKIKNKKGFRVVVGEIQKDNMSESMEIITDLLKNGIGVIPQQSSEILSDLYVRTRNVYIPADIYGGGERAVLEARACGCQVEVEDDNPKLKELLTSTIWDENYYAEQLKKGIESVC